LQHEGPFPLPALGSVPPPELGLNDAFDLQRIRCGVWIKLGEGAAHYHKPPAHCALCGAELRRGGGQPVLHMFSCSAHPHYGVHRLVDLFSEDVRVLRSVLAYCRVFLSPPSSAESPQLSMLTHSSDPPSTPPMSLVPT
jgi:hypothetical protein